MVFPNEQVIIQFYLMKDLHFYDHNYLFLPNVSSCISMRVPARARVEHFHSYLPHTQHNV